MKEIKHLSAAKLKQLMNRLDFFRCVALKDRENLVDNQLIKIIGVCRFEILLIDALRFETPDVFPAPNAP